MTLVVKTEGDPIALAGAVREAMPIDRSQPAGVGHPRDGRGRGRRAGAAALHDVPARAVRGGRARRWPRSGSTARCRCWSPNARRRWASGWRSARSADRSSVWCSARAWCWRPPASCSAWRGGDRPDAHARRTDLRRRRARSADVHGRAGTALCGRAGRLSDPRPPRGLGGPDLNSAPRVIQIHHTLRLRSRRRSRFRPESKGVQHLCVIR